MLRCKRWHEPTGCPNPAAATLRLHAGCARACFLCLAVPTSCVRPCLLRLAVPASCVWPCLLPVSGRAARARAHVSPVWRAARCARCILHVPVRHVLRAALRAHCCLCVLCVPVVSPAGFGAQCAVARCALVRACPCPCCACVLLCSVPPAPHAGCLPCGARCVCAVCVMCAVCPADRGPGPAQVSSWVPLMHLSRVPVGGFGRCGGFWSVSAMSAWQIQCNANVFLSLINSPTDHHG